MVRALKRIGGLAAAAVATLVCRGAAQSGHGPVYALATPLLARGDWSLELSAMTRFAGDKSRTMFRPMIEYGITEDLQVSYSVPVPVYVEQGVAPPVRTVARMSATPDVELTIGWRFHRQGTDVGKRFESTAYLGLTYPTDAVRAGVRTAPGAYVAVASGYASRSVYVWAGALYQRSLSPVGPTVDHLGDLAMYSAVVGYRPPFFRHDFPRPDWRLFVEAVGEYLEPDRVGGQVVANTGGHRILVGPTVLGLYGAWGISGGPMFPVYQRLNGTQDRDRVRLVLNLSTWF